MKVKTPKELALTEKGKKLGWPESTVEVFEKVMYEVTQINEKLFRFLKYFIIDVLEVTTVGGNAIEEFSLPWVKASYRVFAQLKNTGETPVSIVSAKCQAGKIIVEFSADPSNDHIITLVII